MTTTAVVPAGHRQIVPALIVGVLAVAGLGCLTAAAVQLVTTAGPVLLAAGCLLLAGWLVQLVTSISLPGWLLGATVLAAVSPWLGLAALVGLAVVSGGESNA
jgi:hypothetical protein